MDILKIKNLNLKIREKEILKNVSLEIKEGEVIGLIGESGSGKTIFTKYILGILPLAAQYTQETFEVVPKVGAIFQNAFTSLNPTMKIGKQLQHLYISHYGTKKDWKEKIEKLLEDVLDTLVERLCLVTIKGLYSDIYRDSLLESLKFRSYQAYTCGLEDTEIYRRYQEMIYLIEKMDEE